MKSPAFWWNLPPTLPATMLAPLGWVYGKVSHANGMMRARRAQHFSVPVISVGNLTVGGAGKTPLVHWLAGHLATMGHQVAIVSRGYGGNLNDRPTCVRPQTHTAAEVGDEPLSLAQSFPHTPVNVWIGRHRPSVVRRAIQAGTTVVVLDDAFQRRDVVADLILLVVNAATDAPFGNRLPLPAGPLREPLSALTRAHAVVLMNSEAAQPDNTPALPAELTNFSGPIFHLATQPDAASVEPLRNHRLFAFCGLAHPEKFIATLKQAGLNVAGSQFYPDHHTYTPTDLKALQEASHKHQAMRVTTSKDATKLPANFAYVLNITLSGTGAQGLLNLVREKAPFRPA
jgi:tetraacyldisaccharide 4'-kinase